MRVVCTISILSFAILYGCTSSDEHRKKHPEIKQKAFLFNMHHFLSDAEYDLSFPVWFNDSLVNKYMIKSITRKVLRNTETNDAEIREIRKYLFSKQGILEELIVEEYYDDRLVGNLRAKYENKPDEWGFSEEKIIDYQGLELTESNYRSYKKEEYTDKYLVYRNIHTNFYLFYLKKKSDWGVISVDSILNPTPEDIVVYGTPRHPTKKFQIDNKVNESNVTAYTYDRRFGLVTKSVFDNYPFNNKRSFIYDEKGNFSYFVDSTFSEGSYLNKRVSKVEMGDNLLPKMITHEHYIEGNMVGYVENEKFEYEFYTE